MGLRNFRICATLKLRAPGQSFWNRANVSAQNQHLREGMQWLGDEPALKTTVLGMLLFTL